VTIPKSYKMAAVDTAAANYELYHKYLSLSRGDFRAM